MLACARVCVCLLVTLCAHICVAICFEHGVFLLGDVTDADKADGAGVSKSLGEGQKGVEHSGEVATLEFDPENSYALCVGEYRRLL